MKISTLIIMLSVFSLLAYFILSSGGDPNNKTSEYNEPVQNVFVDQGKQIIEIKAKGGFSPRKTYAKAGIPTILKMETKNTFDCSSSVRIPKMDISQSLPPTGVVEIDLGIPKVSVLKGTCSMGMYPFEINFQE